MCRTDSPTAVRIRLRPAVPTEPDVVRVEEVRLPRQRSDLSLERIGDRCIVTLTPTRLRRPADDVGERLVVGLGGDRKRRKGPNTTSQIERVVRGDRETNAVCIRYFGSVDPDYSALAIQQWATAISRVDRGIGSHVGHSVSRDDCTHDPAGGGGLEAEPRAHRKNFFSDFHGFDPAERQYLLIRIRLVELEEDEVMTLRCVEQSRLLLLSLDDNVHESCLANHVEVRDDDAGLDEETASDVSTAFDSHDRLQCLGDDFFLRLVQFRTRRERVRRGRRRCGPCFLLFPGSRQDLLVVPLELLEALSSRFSRGLWDGCLRWLNLDFR